MASEIDPDRQHFPCPGKTLFQMQNAFPTPFSLPVSLATGRSSGPPSPPSEKITEVQNGRKTGIRKATDLPIGSWILPCSCGLLTGRTSELAEALSLHGWTKKHPVQPRDESGKAPLPIAEISLCQSPHCQEQGAGLDGACHCFRRDRLLQCWQEETH